MFPCPANGANKEERNCDESQDRERGMETEGAEQASNETLIIQHRNDRYLNSNSKNWHKFQYEIFGQ